MPALPPYPPTKEADFTNWLNTPVLLDFGYGDGYAWPQYHARITVF